MPDTRDYHTFEHIDWDDTYVTQTVWIDNYESGRYPLANPWVSGPYMVEDIKARRLTNLSASRNRSFIHIPNNLLVRKAGVL